MATDSYTRSWGIWAWNTGEDADYLFDLGDYEGEPTNLAVTAVPEFIIWRGTTVKMTVTEDPSDNGSYVEVLERGEAGVTPAVVRLLITKADLALLPLCESDAKLDIITGPNNYTPARGTVCVEYVP